MKTDKQNRINANIKVHGREAGTFDIIHPELFSKTEHKIILDAIDSIKNATQKKEKVEVLDMACGTGRLSLHFLQAGFSVTALDMSKDMLEILNRKIDKKYAGCMTIVNGEISRFVKCEKKTYDCVIIGAFLHHVEDICDLLTNVVRLTKSDGFIFIIHDPALRKKKSSLVGTILERIDSLLFQMKYLLFHGKVLPRIKEYSISEVHTKTGIDDIHLIDWFKSNKCNVVKYGRYYSHKTTLITFLDKTIFKLLPQFHILVKKENVSDV